MSTPAKVREMPALIHSKKKRDAAETPPRRRTRLAERPAPERLRADAAQRLNPDDIATGLGARVRKLRLERGYTLDELAARAKVSRAMLSKVERSEKSPTLSVVVRIANGLSISMSSLLGVDSDTSDISVVRAHERIVFRDPETGFERQVLSPPHMNNGIEVLLHRIPPGKSSGVLPAYGLPVQKYVVVQEGELLLRMDGKDTTVSAGDTLFFEINAPYRLTNSGRTTCTYYVVMVTRRPAPVAIG